MRKSYIAEQKTKHGRTILAVLPILYPKEILTAMNVLAVEVWGPPGPPRGDDAGRIQTYVCPLVRNAIAFLAAEGIEAVDGVLFPHTCDSIQGLATQLPDLATWPSKPLHFIHPKGEERKSTRKYLKLEMRSLATDLESVTGEALDLDKLVWAIQLHREIDAMRAELTAKRRYCRLNDRELYTLLRRGEFLWPEDHLNELKQAVAELSAEPVQTGVPVMISGIVPEPMSLFDNLNEAGAYVAADDYAAIGRRVVRHSLDTIGDPFEALADLYFKTPPCSTRSGSMAKRRDFLDALYRECGAKGLVLHNIKFCEPELFDIPHIRKHFSDRNIPVLYMESEMETELAGQAVTRLEAFVEMASNHRSHA